MQIVSKVNNSSSRQKIPYIVDSNYKKRECYPRNLNYPKFEKKILEILKQILKIYANKESLKETYNNATNKSNNLLLSVKKQIEIVDIKILDINKKIDKLYDDKLNDVLEEFDFTRISEKYIKEREKLENEKLAFTNKLQILQNQYCLKNIDNIQKMNYLINNFLEMKELNKSCLFRLIDKIEIDKDKNTFISFNFKPLNTTISNIDKFIEIKEILNIEKPI